VLTDLFNTRAGIVSTVDVQNAQDFEGFSGMGKLDDKK
jgi:hypothetical protein